MSFADYSWNAPYARCVAQHDAASITGLEQSYLAAAELLPRPPKCSALRPPTSAAYFAMPWTAPVRLWTSLFANDLTSSTRISMPLLATRSPSLVLLADVLRYPVRRSRARPGSPQ